MSSRLETLPALASHLGVPEDVLASEVRAYNKAAACQGVPTKDGEGDPFGKVVFPHVVDAEGPFYVSTVAPVVHYTMGGVRIDSEARALNAKGKAVVGLFAAGEVSGG